MRGHVLNQTDGHLVLAQGLDGLVEREFAAVDGEALALEFGRDFARGNRAEELIVLAGAPGQGDDHLVELGGELLRIRLVLLVAADGGGLHLLNDGLVRLVGFDGELLGQQEIAPVSFGDLDHVAARAQLGHVFFQDDFHVSLRFRMSGAPP